MTDTIIDRADFFNKRKKPTQKELEDRTDYLCQQIPEIMRHIWDEDVTEEQRVRMLTRILDLVYVEVALKRGRLEV